MSAVAHGRPRARRRRRRCRSQQTGTRRDAPGCQLSDMPVSTFYKGVAIFAGQPAKRVALVKREIDKVNKISDLMELFEIAGDCAWSPEARIFSAARCLAGLELLTE